MKKLIVLAVLVFVCTDVSFAQEEGQQMNDQQKIWMEYMTPGWAQQLLAEHVGEWKTVNKFWMGSPEPMISEGKAVNEMLMGGRYLKSHHTGNMMGMPFEGMSLEGYDNGKKEFTSVWIDNMGTGTMIATGQYDEKEMKITYIGKMYDPMSGKDVDVREVITFVDKDKHVLEMFLITENGDTKIMETEFTRL